MKKSNSTNLTMRPISPRTSTSATDSKTSSDSVSSGVEAKSPKLKQPLAKQNIAARKGNSAHEEADGYLLRNYPEFDDDSSGDETIKASIARWEKKSDELFQSFDTENTKSRNAQKKQAPDEGIEPEKSSKVSIAGQKKEPATDPQLKKRSRAGTLSETLRSGINRLSRASMNQDSMQALTIGEMACLPWKCVRPIATDVNGFPVLDNMPQKLRQKISTQYINFVRDRRYEGLNLPDKEEQLKLLLAKNFLAFALSDSASQFKKEKIGPAGAINHYLLNSFGLKIDHEPASVTTANSGRTQPNVDDFRDLLVQYAVLHSKNYQIDYSVALGNVENDPFIKKIFEGTIEATKNNETVSKTTNQRTDVTATFQRDFPNSVYEFESADGSIKPFTSINEFVQFVGDPLKSGLPEKVSHFACQNTGIFIKNLLFTKTDDKGQPQSALKLFDDTPLAISSSPKAYYRLKKANDGTVTLHYRSKIDTTGAAAQGKNTARLLVPGNERSVLIENAHATCTLDIAFHPDGTVRMDTLHFRAAGWNNISE